MMLAMFQAHALPICKENVERICLQHLSAAVRHFRPGAGSKCMHPRDRCCGHSDRGTPADLAAEIYPSKGAPKLR
jgi:hypothetical protein